MTTTDPRVRRLAEHMHDIARQKATSLPAWADLSLTFRDQAVAEARLWLRAAVEAGIAPPAERPTDEHDAVYVDDDGFLYGEYRTSPESDALIRLVWASELTESKRELEERGAEFRLLGWST
ncbi:MULTISPECIES: hypothetical protein [unclassified Streptomyces]|uniref:hypothetical protein n=1 Tax=unclassified Streptomyces TaxID=2593676 RepID=UPI0036EE47DF